MPVPSHACFWCRTADVSTSKYTCALPWPPPLRCADTPRCAFARDAGVRTCVCPLPCCAVWELATGDRPWRSLTPGAILQRVMMAGARPAVPLWLPPAFVRLMVSCWAQEPKDRPTFQAVAARLGAIVADGAILDPVRAGPAGPS